MRITKRGLAPTEVNIRPPYRGIAELEDICLEFTDEVNNTRPPPEMR
ncbi:Transposase [Streptomyces hygroscopicus]|nr:Transposase [Streptomyces hygroscopicus]